MKRAICVTLFLCCILYSYATEPISIFRVKSFAVNYENRWSTYDEYKGTITLYKDRIVNRSGTREATFMIIGKIEKFTDSDGIAWLTFECLNEDLKACIIALTYLEEFDSRCMYIMYSTHQVRYIIKDDDEY